MREHMSCNDHWDDMLVNGIPIPDHVHLSDAELYAIIAAVEDWHKAKRDARVRTHSAECWRWHQECAEYRIEKLSAQVQAVRELCQSARVGISKGCLCHGDECSGTCGRGKPLAWNLNPDDILRILDGDA